MGERVRAARSERRRANTVKSGSERDSQQGIVDRAVTIKAWYKGYEYTARLRKNGTIRLGTKIFDSPSQAAVSIRRKPTNGWHFWQVRNGDGEWVRLRTLRR